MSRSARNQALHADANVKNCTQKILNGTLSQNVRRVHVVFVSRHVRDVVYVREGEREREKKTNSECKQGTIKTQSTTTQKTVVVCVVVLKTFRRDRRARVS